MNKPLLIVGDALLDVDLIGTAGRLSPDGPVPVLHDLVEQARPGGAGLAALLAARMGAEVSLVTALGSDEAGARAEELLTAEGVEVLRLPYKGSTSVKTRVRSHGQTVVRLDSGDAPGEVGEPTSLIRDRLRQAGGVLVSDYARGVTGSPRLRQLLESLAPRTPLVWDPHPRGARPIAGTTLATPNDTEAVHFTAPDAAPPGPQTYLSAVRHRAETLAEAWGCRAVAVTLGERGAMLSYGSGAPAVIPARAVNGADPCGAGDCFAVTAAIALARGAVLLEAVEHAVAGAAEYVSNGGPAGLLHADPRGEQPRTAEQVIEAVRSRGGTVVATGGCFDLLHAGHVATLRAARSLGDCLVVCVNSDDSVRRLKGPTRPLVSAPDRVRVLEALEFVDAVAVFDETTPVTILEQLRPDVWAKGGDYAGAETPESAVIRAWGGQAVVLPYLEGRSTTRLVQSAASRTDNNSTKETV